jgi:hypothetical protein
MHRVRSGTWFSAIIPPLLETAKDWLEPFTNTVAKYFVPSVNGERNVAVALSAVPTDTHG